MSWESSIEYYRIINETTKLEGFGISIGLTRLFDVLKKHNLLPSLPTPPAKILVAYREVSLQSQAVLATRLLREAGLSTDLYCGKSAIGKQEIVTLTGCKILRYS